MVASKTHWRILIVGVLAFMAAALIAPRWSPGPQVQENRTLAAAPHWTGGLAGLTAFRQATDAYVADHFPARRHLIAALNRLRLIVGVSGSPKVIVGREGWLFYDDGSHLGGVRADPPWGYVHTRDWLRVLAGRTEALRARGGAYVAFVAPLKETVYPQFGPWWLNGASPRHASLRMPPIVEASGVGVLVSPSKAMDRARDAGLPVYSRHDTHWTGEGAYIGYVALMDRLHAMGLTEGPRPRSDFGPAPPLSRRQTPHDLAKMLGVGAYVDVRYGLLQDREYPDRAKTIWLTPAHHWSKPHIIETGMAGKPVLLMTVDSFSNALLPLMYRHFSRIIVVHNEEGSWRQDLIDRYQPDIVILEVVEGGLKFSFNEGPAASPEALARIDAALPVETSGLPVLTPVGAAQRQIIERAKGSARCYVDNAALEPARSRSGGALVLFEITGWAVGGPQDGFVRLSGPGGDLTAPLDFNLLRSDVGKAFNAPQMSKSGFDQAFVIKAPAPGVYTIDLYRKSGAFGPWLECRASQSLTIAGKSP